MLNGKLLTKTRKMVPGSHRMESYQDTWQDSIDIDYAGELTPDVCRAIKVAFSQSKFCNKGGSSYGALLWSNVDEGDVVDVQNLQLLSNCSMGICD
jgi:hypothetical protein